MTKLKIDLREPRRRTHRSTGRRATGRGRSLLRADRRPRCERRRACSIRDHRMDARAPRRGEVPAARRRHGRDAADLEPSGW